MEALSGPSVHIRDRERVERMIKNIIHGGRNGLQVKHSYTPVQKAVKVKACVDISIVKYLSIFFTRI